MPEKIFEAARLGRKGGAVKSDRKTAAARINGRKGARKGGAVKSKDKTITARMNGRKGGRPHVHHIGTEYTLTDSRKLFLDDLPLKLSEEQFSTLKRALAENNLRAALIKAKRFWNKLDQDPELTEQEEKSLSARRSRAAHRKQIRRRR